MGVVVIATYKGAPTAVTAFEVGPLTSPWKARVIADDVIHVKVQKEGVKESGTIEFTEVAEDDDTVTIDDGINDPVVFTFGDGTGGTVDKGATAADSAQNLKTAINTDATINVTVTGDAALLTVVNDNYTGGAITKSDVDDDYTVVDFSGGEAGPMPTTSDYPQMADQEAIWDVPAGAVLSVRAASSADVWVSEVA